MSNITVNGKLTGMLSDISYHVTKYPFTNIGLNEDMYYFISLVGQIYVY